MNHLEVFKKLTTICYLPKFSIIHFKEFSNILYLPNQGTNIKILGKWSSNWYSNENYIIGHLEQDSKKNIIFNICAYYEVKKDTLEQISKESFIVRWNTNYKHDYFLMPIHFIISENFIEDNYTKPIIHNNKLIEKPICKPINKPISKPIMKEKTIDCLIDITPKENKEVKTEVKYEVKLEIKPEVKVEVKLEEKDKVLFKVCKTDKPEIYHVYNNGKQISTCLIPNIKTSKYMNILFEEKDIGEFIELEMRLHEKSGKYIPFIN